MKLLTKFQVSSTHLIAFLPALVFISAAINRTASGNIQRKNAKMVDAFNSAEGQVTSTITINCDGCLSLS